MKMKNEKMKIFFKNEEFQSKKMKKIHNERRHFVLLCDGAARWENLSLLSAIAEVTVICMNNAWFLIWRNEVLQTFVGYL